MIIYVTYTELVFPCLPLPACTDKSDVNTERGHDSEDAHPNYWGLLIHYTR